MSFYYLLIVTAWARIFLCIQLENHIFTVKQLPYDIQCENHTFTVKQGPYDSLRTILLLSNDFMTQFQNHTCTVSKWPACQTMTLWHIVCNCLSALGVCSECQDVDPNIHIIVCHWLGLLSLVCCRCCFQSLVLLPARPILENCCLIVKEESLDEDWPTYGLTATCNRLGLSHEVQPFDCAQILHKVAF